MMVIGLFVSFDAANNDYDDDYNYYSQDRPKPLPAEKAVVGWSTTWKLES